MKIRALKTIDRLSGILAVNLLRPPSVNSIDVNVDPSFLLIRPGGIGDAAHLIPTIQTIRGHYPDADIDILAEKRNYAVFSLCPDVHNLYCYDSPRELLAAIRGGYDVVIDTEQWHRLSAVVARLTRAPLLIGFGTNERRRLFTHSIPYSHDEYEVDSFFRLLAPLGIEPPSELTTPWLTIPQDAMRRAETLLGELQGERFAVIFPGASIPERRWGAERFSAVAVDLFRSGTPVVVVGGKEDAKAGETIVKGVKGLNLAGRTSLVETAAVISRSTLLISGDSGILHIGVGLGISTVSLFGPGIAAKWSPHGDVHKVLNRHLPCSPCTKFGYTPRCPYNVRCMEEISVDDVVSAVTSLLSRV